MQDVLAVYTRPRDPDYPLACPDETSKQFLAETRLPIPMKRGRFEGTPIPTSLVLVAVLASAIWEGKINDMLWLGSVQIGPW